MFEPILEAKLQRIFGFKKFDYAKPSSAEEQEVMFIQVTNARCRTKTALFTAKVTGTLEYFVRNDKMPFGTFAKKIGLAKKEDLAPFFFGPEENKGTYRDITHRSVSFVFLFSGQYDPNVGTLETLNLTLVET